MIVVSHDRYFLNQISDQLLALDGTGRVHVIYGNYDTYEMMRAQAEAARLEEEATKKAKEEGRASSAPRVAAKAAEKAGKRKRKFPFRKIEAIEADILASETEVRELETAMASPELYRDAEQGAADDEGIRGCEGVDGAVNMNSGRRRRS